MPRMFGSLLSIAACWLFWLLFVTHLVGSMHMRSPCGLFAAAVIGVCLATVKSLEVQHMRQQAPRSLRAPDVGM